MDSSIEGAGLNTPNCTTLSLEERRDLIHALLNQPDEASRVLHSWSRHEILKILCVEMGKERKYTGLTKSKLVENLLNLMSRSGTASGRRNSKRKQKTDSSESSDTVCCENSACRAVLRHDKFCKRCSCCVCRKYDDNKDPSLWLTCGPELPCERDGCGLSCHLECALRHERSGIGRDGERGRLDGSFYCVSCGKENDLLGCLRKQMKVAKETRRVDILCYRVSLGQKLLRGTSKHRKLLGFMDEAAQKLEADVGPLLGSPLNMARGIVNRLCSGPHVQELCSLALDSLDKMLSDSVSSQGTDQVYVRLEEVRARSITVSTDSQESSYSQSGIRGFRLFCRKSIHELYSKQETCVLYLPDTRSTITGLDPETKFCLKAVAFNAEGELGASELRFSTPGDEDEASNCKLTERSQSPLTNSSGLCNPSSVEDESNNTAPFIVQNNRRDGKDDNNNVGSPKEIEAGNAGKADNKMEVSELREARLVEGNTHDKRVKIEGDLPVTPCKIDTQGKKKRIKRSKSDTETGAKMMEEHEKGSTTGKTRGNTDKEVYNANGVPDKDMGHAVKMIRCLEQEGHIDKCFRERFLTWYSLRATHREVRVVKLFIDTFTEDLASLGEQLVDTFSECILSKRSTAFVPAGICLKLWH